MRNLRRMAIWAGLTAALMALSSVGTWYLATRREPSVIRRIPVSMLKSPQFLRFVDTYRLIRQESVWTNSPNELLLGATNGMVGTLHDQFSNYLSQSATENLHQLLDPTYAGVGVEVSTTLPLTIKAVFPGSPAARAGLKAGEEITAVDGRPVQAMGAAAAVNRIRGKAGTSVRLELADQGRVRTVTLVRTVIAMPTVFGKMLAPRVGYLEIAEFGTATGQQAAQEFHRLVSEGARGFIVDLRDDPGGEVAQAVKVADLFVPPGPVVTLKYKNPANDQTLDSSGPGTRWPVVVLVNGNTASAAEILSAAIRERQGGVLVGTRTYGKGIVQEVVPLPGHAALKLTVAKYYTPDGHYIEHVGLTPNVVVKEPTGVVPSDNPKADPQLARALAVLKTRMSS